MNKTAPKTVNVEDLLLHPVRMRILLTLAGKQLTSQEVAEKLPDVAHATLYRHIAKLGKAGVLVVVDEQQKRGVKERTWALADLQHMDMSESFSHATDNEKFRYFLSFTTSLLQDFALYLKFRKNQSEQDIGFHSHVLNLSDHEFKRVTAKLNEVFKPYLENGQSSRRTPRTLSTIIIPRISD